MTSDLDEAIRLLRELRRCTDPYHARSTVLCATVDVFLEKHPEPPKLLNCPCCGGAPRTNNSYGKCRVECTGCGLKVTRDPVNVVPAELAAQQAWNRRTP